MASILSPFNTYTDNRHQLTNKSICDGICRGVFTATGTYTGNFPVPTAFIDDLVNSCPVETMYCLEFFYYLVF